MSERKHLLGIEGLGKDEILSILESARGFLEISEREIKKTPALRGKTVINLFFEPSTRTRTSFEIAAKRLSADTVNISSSTSSTTKGETLIDTVKTLQSMKPDVLVIRHSQEGAPVLAARHLADTSVINAGDGMHEHPTQALLDCLSLSLYYNSSSSKPHGIEGLNIAIVGDILHSRVARSNILLHGALGNKVTLVGPPTLAPPLFEDAYRDLGVKVSHNLREGLEGADVVICLRMQFERQSEFFVPSIREYSREFCVTEEVLSSCCPDAVILHPGPVNRGIEVASDVAFGPRSLVRDQVKNGVALRMAVLFWLVVGGN